MDAINPDLTHPDWMVVESVLALEKNTTLLANSYRKDLNELENRSAICTKERQIISDKFHTTNVARSSLETTQRIADYILGTFSCSIGIYALSQTTQSVLFPSLSMASGILTLGHRMTQDLKKWNVQTYSLSEKHANFMFAFSVTAHLAINGFCAYEWQQGRLMITQEDLVKNGQYFLSCANTFMGTIANAGKHWLDAKKSSLKADLLNNDTERQEITQNQQKIIQEIEENLLQMQTVLDGTQNSLTEF